MKLLLCLVFFGAVALLDLALYLWACTLPERKVSKRKDSLNWLLLAFRPRLRRMGGSLEFSTLYSRTAEATSSTEVMENHILVSSSS